MRIIFAILFILLSFEVSYANYETLFAMTDDQIYISKNSGNSWSGIYVESATTVRYNYMCFDSKNKIAYAGTNTCLIKSTDGGKYWSKILPSGDSEPVNRVAVSKDGANALYAATLDGLYMSTDNGRSWASLSLPTRQGYFLLPFSKEKRIYLGGGQTIYISNDNGKSWKNISSGLPEDMAILDIAVNPKNTLQLFVATTEGLYYSGNGGKHWKQRNISPKEWIQTNKITYSNTDNPVLYALDNDVKESGISYLRKSTNGGKNWLVIGSKENIPLFTIATENPMVVYYTFTSSMALSGIESSLSTVMKSTDGGKSWKSLESVMPGYTRTKLLLLRPW